MLHGSSANPIAQGSTAESRLSAYARFATGMMVEDSRADLAEVPDNKGWETHRSIYSGKMDIMACDEVCSSDYEYRIQGPQLLKLSFVRKADFHMTLGSWRLDHPIQSRCQIFIQPRGMVKESKHYSGDRCSLVHLIISSEASDSLQYASARNYPKPVKSFLSGSPSDFHASEMAFTPQMLGCVSELLDRSHDDPLSNLIFECKSLELYYHYLSGYNDFDAESFSAREMRIAKDVGNLLELEYARPPSLPNIASQIGIGQSRLTEIFRRFYGMSIGEYCLQKRMCNARKLIQSDELSLAQIAHLVGYEHHSSFCAAYVRFFGRAPGSDKRL